VRDFDLDSFSCLFFKCVIKNQTIKITKINIIRTQT